MNIIKKITNEMKAKKKYKNMRYGAITRQLVPVFHDQWHNTNKTFKEFLLDEEELSFSPLESQNGVKVEFYKGFYDYGSKNFKRHKGNKDFEVAGFKQGDEFHVVGCGFLENIDYLSEVVLVTDSFLYTLNTKNNIMIIYRHDEIKTMEETGGVIRELSAV